jgi:hypothetical protein
VSAAIAARGYCRACGVQLPVGRRPPKEFLATHGIGEFPPEEADQDETEQGVSEVLAASIGRQFPETFFARLEKPPGGAPLGGAAGAETEVEAAEEGGYHGCAAMIHEALFWGAKHYPHAQLVQAMLPPPDDGLGGDGLSHQPSEPGGPPGREFAHDAHEAAARVAERATSLEDAIELGESQDFGLPPTPAGVPGGGRLPPPLNVSHAGSFGAPGGRNVDLSRSAPDLGRSRGGGGLGGGSGGGVGGAVRRSGEMGEALRASLPAGKVSEFLADLQVSTHPPCRVGVVACASSHRPPRTAGDARRGRDDWRLYPF